MVRSAAGWMTSLAAYGARLTRIVNGNDAAVEISSFVPDDPDL